MSSNQPSKYVTAELPFAKELLDQLILPVVLLIGTFLFGTVGFFAIGAGQWRLIDCAYMTSITLTTVGYGEVIEGMGDGSRLFAMTVMWVGMGITLYAVSTITAFIVEKNLGRIIKERRMEKKIAALNGHIIVCGAGNTGINVIRELHATRHPCVTIEGNAERLQLVQQQYPELYCLCGDATEEEVLKRAGIERAAGLIATLNDDSHNLLIIVQARFVNPGIKIVARCNENNLVDKFTRAGANYIVNPAFIGGMRMVSEMIRPHVVSFLDCMLRSRNNTVRFEEVTIGGSSEFAGRTLAESDIQRYTGLLPIALKHPGETEFRYNPPQSEKLQEGTVLVVIGTPEQMAHLRDRCLGCVLP